jgi:Ribbon-helix-helix protein, copG family
MPRRSLKPKKRLKVDTRVSPEEDAILKRLAIELNISKSEVMRLGLSEEADTS